MKIETNPHIDYEISSHPGFDLDFFQQEFSELIGMPTSIPITVVIDQLIGDLISKDPLNKERVNYMLAFVATQKPASLLEAQLLIQLLSIHRFYTEMLHKATEEKYPENIDKYTNIAMKLFRGYKTGLETLAKYRRNGKQSIHIEHIHVEKNANALIGNVESIGEGK